MNPRPTLLPVLALVLAALPLPAEDKTLVRQHWEPGKVYHLETNMDMEMAMPGLPGGGGQTTSVIQQLEVTVRKEPGTDRKLAEMKFTAIKAVINIAGQLKTFDSSDPAMSEPMLQQAFGALLGKSVTLVYDKDDKFLDVIVPEGFMATPLGQAAGPDGKQFANMLRENVDFGLPTKALAVGETFDIEKKIEMPPMGAITTKMKGRLDSMVDHEGRKHAKLVMEGTMEMPELPPDAANLVSISPGATIKSELLFDLERKAVSRSAVTTEMKMNAAGREMATKQTVVSTLKSIKDAPAGKK